MSVCPSRTSLTPSPCSTISRSGNAAPPWLTRYAGPVSGLARIGVLAVAVPTSDSFGQDAGFASKTAARHAFCSVVRRDGSCLGSETLTERMLASPPPGCGPPLEVTFTSRLAPDALLACPAVDTEKDGLNGRVAQPAAWKRLESGACAPPIEVTVALMAFGSQLVGLNVKPGRSRVTSTRLILRGMPLRIVGKGSETSVTCASVGSMKSAWRITTVPRSNGPATAGTMTATP